MPCPKNMLRLCTNAPKHSESYKMLSILSVTILWAKKIIKIFLNYKNVSNNLPLKLNKYKSETTIGTML